jgi:D-alanine transaminase
MPAPIVSAFGLETSSVPLANLNGAIMPLTEAKVPVLDRGYLFGDGVYEALRVYRGRLWLEDEHFARLARSLDELRIRGVDLARLRRRCRETLSASGFGEALLYLQVTRGVAPRAHAFPAAATPTELIWVQEYRDGYAELRANGAGVVLFPDLRWDRCDIKSLNLLGNVLAANAAKEAGCIEAVLYRRDGTLTEASHSSFCWVHGGVVYGTPNSHAILPGTTRGRTAKLAAQVGVEFAEATLRRQELDTVDELLLTGTTMEVMPVVRVDGKTVCGGKPGPVTRKLQEAYREAVRAFLAGHE